ncbi:MAG: glycosyltransferase family 2 protein [Bacteroidota bacterium]
MKVSIVTVTYNAAEYLRSCMDSVVMQDYPDIEYIVIDGNSNDGTQDIIKSYGEKVHTFVSEPDKGIYDAMNKGIHHATGDVVGILNADDFYVHTGVISKIVEAFQEEKVETVFGDLVIVDPVDTDKVERYYSGKTFKPSQVKQGHMPPHPTFFVKRELYEKYGVFNQEYRIVGDFELITRFLHIHQASYHHIPDVMVRMRSGGHSQGGFATTMKLNKEMLSALRNLGIKSSLPMIYSKYFFKVFQLVNRPNEPLIRQ